MPAIPKSFQRKPTIATFLFACLIVAGFSPLSDGGVWSSARAAEQRLPPGDGARSQPDALAPLSSESDEVVAVTLRQMMLEAGASQGVIPDHPRARLFLETELEMAALLLLEFLEDARQDRDAGRAMALKAVLAHFGRGNPDPARELLKATHQAFDDMMPEITPEERLYVREVAARTARSLGALALLQDLGQAVSYYEQARQIEPGNSGHEERLSIAYLLAGRQGDAWTTIAKLGQEYKNPEVVAESLGALGNLAQKQGDLRKAEDYHRKAIALYTRTGNRLGIAKQTGNLGQILENREDLEGAEKLYRQSRALYEELGDRQGLASQLVNLGSIARLRENYDAAEDFYRRSLNLETALGNKEGISTGLSSLGLIARLQGKLDEAEDYYRRALTLDEETDNRTGKAVAFSNLGSIAQDRGELDKAEDYFRRALTLNEQLGRKTGAGIQYLNLGILAARAGDLDKGEDFTRKGLAYFVESGAESARKQALTNIALIQRKREQNREAQQ